ncbi:phage tail tape measure protein [Acinetobacter sp. HY1485]|uniref:phage tail tape measure protein n=1 Tax=Acinetobacter sp. HY1485 TaxID=2970918 RepID=UPI0022B98F7C|nr:phage tail tape measure protein [Acinetobacter sp. HY1485]
MKSLKLEILFGAKDRLSPALRAMIGGSNATNQALKKTQDQLKNLQAQQKQIEGYEKQKTAIEQNNTALHQMQQRMAQLKTEIANNKFKHYTQELQTAQHALEQTNQRVSFLNANQRKVDGFFTQKRAIIDSTKSLEALQQHIQQLKQQMQNNGSAKLSQEFKKATTQADQLKASLLAQKQALQTTRNELQQAGIKTNGLAQTQVKLRQQIEQANTATSRYKKSVAELEQQQQKEKKALDDLSKKLKTTETEASKLTTTIGTQKTKLKQLEEGLKETGLSSHNLADQQGKLKQQITETNTSLDSQKKKLANLNRVRESSNNIKQNAQMAAASGATMMATGVTAAYGLSKMIGESKNYEIERNRVGALGVGQEHTDEIIAFAKGMKTFGTSTKENLALARDALTVFGGDVHHAEMAAPILAKMKAANETMFGHEQGAENEKKFMDMLKVIELRGGLKNEAAFKEQANMLQQVITATGGRVQAEEWLNAIKTGGIAAKGIDNKAFYYKMEPIVQEMGGFRVGTAMMSAYQNVYQGKTTQKAVRAMDGYGLLGDPKKIHHNKTGDASYMDIGAIKGAELFKKDQFAWMEEVMLPQLAKQGITKESDVLDAIGNIFSNRTASNLFATMYQQRANVHKNAKLNEGAENIGQMSDRAEKTTVGKELDAKAKLHDLYLELGQTILPIYTKAMEMATDALQGFTTWMKDNPTYAKALGIGLTILTGCLLAVGGALVVFSPLIAGLMTLRIVMASFSMLTTVFNPFMLALTLLAVAAILIYTNWEPIKAFFLELWDSVSKWATETWQAITKGASDAWNGVCGFFGGISDWFADKWNKVTTSVQDVWNGITTGASNAWNGITDGIGSVWDTIKNTFNAGVNWVIQTFTDLWTTFKSIVNSVDQFLARNPILNFLLFPIGIPRMIIANWSSIKGFFADVWNGVVQSTCEAWNSICAFFSPIGQWFSTQWNTVKTSANSAWQGLKDGASDAWNGICGFFSSIGNWFSTQWDSVKTSANNAWQGVKDGASDAWNGICEYFSPIGDWFTDKWNTVSAGASTAWEATKSGASSSYNTITEVFAPVTNWFTDRWNNIKKAFDGGLIGIGALIMNWSPLGLFYKAFASVLNWFGIELPSTFSGFGSMIIDGLVAGIEKGFDKLKGVWEKVNSWMPDWTRKTMDIHSPSRVMKGLGRFIVDGLGVGVEQGQDSLKGKFNNTLNLFNQDTPHIDLSTKVTTGLQVVKDIALEPILAKIRPIHLTPQPSKQPSAPITIEGDTLTIQIHAQPHHSAQDIASIVETMLNKRDREKLAKARTSFFDMD